MDGAWDTELDCTCVSHLSVTVTPEITYKVKRFILAQTFKGFSPWSGRPIGFKPLTGKLVGSGRGSTWQNQLFTSAGCWLGIKTVSFDHELKEKGRDWGPAIPFKLWPSDWKAWHLADILQFLLPPSSAKLGTKTVTPDAIKDPNNNSLRAKLKPWSSELQHNFVFITSHVGKKTSWEQK